MTERERERWRGRWLLVKHNYFCSFAASRADDRLVLTLDGAGSGAGFSAPLAWRARRVVITIGSDVRGTPSVVHRRRFAAGAFCSVELALARRVLSTSSRSETGVLLVSIGAFADENMLSEGE